MNKLEIVYYIGIFTLILGVIMLVTNKFKEYENINLKKHYKMITLYIILLVLSIIAWRIMFNFFFGFADIINQNKIDYKSILNG